MNDLLKVLMWVGLYLLGCTLFYFAFAGICFLTVVFGIIIIPILAIIGAIIILIGLKLWERFVK